MISSVKGKQGDVTRSDLWDALDAWCGRLPEKVTSKSPARGRRAALAKVLGWDRCPGHWRSKKEGALHSWRTGIVNVGEVEGGRDETEEGKPAPRLEKVCRGFPDTVDENLLCNAGDTGLISFKEDSTCCGQLNLCATTTTPALELTTHSY